MTAAQKTLIEKALKLPSKVKARFAEKLIESLNGEAELLLLEGAKRAHESIEACRQGKEEVYSEEEILALLISD